MFLASLFVLNLYFFCSTGVNASSAFVPSVLTGLIGGGTSGEPASVGVVENPPARLLPANCGGGGGPAAELHVISAKASLRAGVLTVRVSRAQPVVLVLNSYCCSAVTWVVYVEPGTVVQKIVLTKPFDSTTAYTGVEVRGLGDGDSEPELVDASQFPFSPFGNHWQLPSADTDAFLSRVSQLVGLPVASFHGLDKAMEFAIGPAQLAAAPVCAACSGSQSERELWSWTEGKCVCAPGFHGTAGGSCVPLLQGSPPAMQLTAMRAPASVSNAVRGLLSATVSGLVDSLGWRCRLRKPGSPSPTTLYESDAYANPATSSLGCLIQPGPDADSPNVPPGDYDLEFAHPAAPNVWAAVPGSQPANVFDGVARCASASSCAVCDKNACVWCAAVTGDTAAACVPGATGARANGPTWGSCSSFAGGDTCPPSSLVIDGQSAWGKLRGGELHAFDVEVKAGDADLEVWLQADPVTNQDKADLYLVGPGAGAPVAPWADTTPDDSTHLSKRAAANLNGATLVLVGCALAPGNWSLSVVGRSLFTYRVGVRRGCSCAGQQGAVDAATPQLTSLNPLTGPRLVLLKDEPPTVSVSGSGFVDGPGLLCRVRSSRCQPQAAGDISRNPPCSTHTTESQCLAAPLCEWAGRDHVAPAVFKSTSLVECSLPRSADVFAASSPARPEAPPSPETLLVSVSNTGCRWAEPSLPFALWMPVDFAAHVPCPSQCQRPAVDGRLLAPNTTDVWLFDLGPGSAHAGASAAQLLIEMTDAGSRDGMDVWLAKQTSASAPLLTSKAACSAAGGTLCSVAVPSPSSMSGILLDKCNLSADKWLLHVRNSGNSLPVSYSVTVQCGCQGSAATQTSALVPAAGLVDGFDVVTVKGQFVADLATQCLFSVGTQLPVATAASFVDSTTVRCLTPSLPSLLPTGSAEASGPAEASVYVSGVGTGMSSCAVSRVPLSYYYSVPLYTGVETTGTTLGAEPLVFVLDFGEVLAGDNQSQDPVKSFRVSASLGAALARYRVLVREGQMPDLNDADQAVSMGSQSVLVCNGARTSRWFVVLDVLFTNPIGYTLNVVDAMDNECPDYTGATGSQGNDGANGDSTTAADSEGTGSSTNSDGLIENGASGLNFISVAHILILFYFFAVVNY